MLGSFRLFVENSNSFLEAFIAKIKKELIRIMCDKQILDIISLREGRKTNCNIVSNFINRNKLLNIINNFQWEDFHSENNYFDKLKDFLSAISYLEGISFSSSFINEKLIALIQLVDNKFNTFFISFLTSNGILLSEEAGKCIFNAIEKAFKTYFGEDTDHLNFEGVLNFLQLRRKNSILTDLRVFYYRLLENKILSKSGFFAIIERLQEYYPYIDFYSEIGRCVKPEEDNIYQYAPELYPYLR